MGFELSGEAPFSTVIEFLGGPRACADEAFAFEFGPHLDSSWGGTYGGALAAATVRVARLLVPGRAPRSLHVQFIRQVGLGGVRATAAVVNHGRVISTVEVRMFEQRGKLAVLGLATMTDSSGLQRDLQYTDVDTLQFRRVPLASNAHGATPVVRTLQMPTVLEAWEVTNVPPGVSGQRVWASPAITPWRDLEASGPELACVVGDLCNGGGISAGLPPQVLVAFPNSDLSLRFASDDATETAVGVGTLLAVHDGTAIVDFRVQAGTRQLARGLIGSILLPLGASSSSAVRWEKAEQSSFID